MDIWKPFYVVEDSRNKDLSGTGLELSIAASILEANEIEYGAKLFSNEIEFYIIFV